ncbi:GmrSD restriction endonuclease domain-containing protein [Cellulomonas sp. CW35]|uniref:GmrSD restriction endonuclease domain-containing protein n=1 Tax=Cellulomonas sp. CW35 TaxID=3458249 RepID=UPI0040342F12
MKAYARTPAEIFGNSVRYVVPLFQRPYVWERDTQWQPLWEDVRTLAERVLDAPSVAFGPAQVSPHFLGAVVVDQQSVPAGFIDVRHVVDGQQRLTTLQLLLDAVQGVVAEHGSPQDAAGLHSLARNNSAIAGRPEEVFKVWPTDRDQAAFTAAMEGNRSGELSGSLLVRAHRYFTDAAREWALAEPNGVGERLAALTQALAQHLRLVVIDLEPGDNAQVIFETLNHRGSPLLAADLIKNLVFQVAQSRRLDVVGLYRRLWRPFDTDEWRRPQRQGRLMRPRLDVFFHHWLTMRLVQEVPADQVFATFRDRVLAAEDVDLVPLLEEIAHDAQVYAGMDALPATSVPGLFRYRVLQTLDATVVWPVLLWLLRQAPADLPTDQRDTALRALESWLVRRALVRGTSKDLNNAVLTILRVLRDAAPATAGDALVDHLESQTAPSRSWPDDLTVTTTLLRAPVYLTLTRPRLRMVLEALEDHHRGPLGEGIPCPRNLTIEHVMPQAWREHWTAYLDDDADLVAERDERLHRLGNLTLVSGRLNPTLSNRPWRDEHATRRGLGQTGKRTYLLEHAQLKLSAAIAARHESAWTDEDIDDRTAVLVDSLLRIWPGPAERRAVEPADDAEATQPADEDAPATAPDSDASGEARAGRSRNAAGTYDSLREWLAEQPIDVVSLSFEQVEDVVAAPLPASARAFEQHWRGYQGSALYRAIVDAGWRTAVVDLDAERVVLQRAPEEAAEDGSAREQRTRTVHLTRVVDLVEAGLLPTGTRLTGQHLGTTFGVTVLADGRLRADDGELFTSPSTAAAVVSGQDAVNGWRFWRPEPGRTLADLRDLLP